MNTQKSHDAVRNITFSALFLALALFLPFLTGQIPYVGRMLSPMHIPAFLCGFVCGPVWGGMMGLAAPLLRHVLFQMPPLPVALPMSAELLVYGVLAGLLSRLLPQKTGFLYLSLLLSMIGGRVVYACIQMVLFGLGGKPFSPWLVFADTVTGTWAGILLHLVIVPPVVLLLRRYVLRPRPMG